MSFIPVKADTDPAASFATSTLILPTVSIGNVPQLVSDLLISTFQMDRTGWIDADSVLPLAGLREDTKEHKGVTVPIEVFQTKDRLYTCVQQRSPTLKGRKTDYIRDITMFAKQFKKIVLMTSMDAARRLDSQIQGSGAHPFRVYSRDDGHDLMKKALDILQVPVLENMAMTPEWVEGDGKIHLYGSGLAKYLYEELERDENVQTLLTVMFALEGDNAQDAIEYASFINSLLDINTSLKSWNPPKSWNLLFGTPYNSELYQ
ncbi:PAC2 family-domain-containing protein [Mycotypha africana]|uniref:PAC2 family-domain-containing protein n=1 Tax=Mycotypha africana TaxID=64632 RepID=UPI0022FFD804|nr:PAC2 family-domain-containing protein [Mycotypha africana]KAI8970288.1 PAC2 family-domain-containing protein [Mycotypha africana]